MRLFKHGRDKQSRQKETSAGFTLMELLVVLAILGLLASFAVPRVLKYFSSAKTDTAAIQINNLSAALDLYRLETGRYPTTSEGLKALIDEPDGARGWDGPYIDKREGSLILGAGLIIIAIPAKWARMWISSHWGPMMHRAEKMKIRMSQTGAPSDNPKTEPHDSITAAPPRITKRHSAYSGTLGADAFVFDRRQFSVHDTGRNPHGYRPSGCGQSAGFGGWRGLLGHRSAFNAGFQ